VTLRSLQKLLFAFVLSWLSSLAQETAPALETQVADTNQVEEIKPVRIKEASEGHEERASEDHWRRRYEPIVKFRGDVTVLPGETVGDIVIIGGKLKMDGEVHGSVVAVASETSINGYVRNDLVVVPGPLSLGPKAEVRQETVVVGSYTKDAAAKLGEFIPVEIPEMVPVIGGLKDFLFEGLLMFRPLPPGVEWVWYVHIGMFLALLGLSLLFPTPVRLGAETIAERPVMSMFSGFLTIVLFVPVLALVALTVIGLPVAIMALVLSALFGKAAVMTFLGQQIGRNLNVTPLQSPLVAMLVGALVLIALYMVPVVGMLVWAIATLLGIGSMMVATASALNNRPTIPTPTAYPPAATPAAPIDPASVTATTIPTAEAVPSTTTFVTTSTPAYYRRVGFWKRTFAALLDLLLLSIPMGLLGGFAPLLLIAYFVGMWTWKGTSIGKICLGLKIVRIDGTPIDFAVALVRSLASCFSFAVFLLGFFWAGWDKEKQSWHDKIAGTIVVQVPKGVSLL
jgi:uncharacterized RDD family membrane protein YckC